VTMARSLDLVDMANRFEISGSRLARNGLLHLAGQGLPFLVGLASVPAILHGLGTERFGLLGLTWAFLSALSVFDLGLGRAVTKFVAEALGRGDAGSIPGILWPAVVGQLVFGTLGGGILATIAPSLVAHFLNVTPQMESEAILAFRVLALTLPVVLIAFSFQGVLEAAQRFDLLTGIRTIASSSTFLVPLAGVLLHWSLPRIMAGLLLVRILVLAAQVLACIRVLPIMGGPVAVDRSGLRPLLTFGGWITVSGLMALILTSADRLAIGNLLTMTALAYYTVPLELISRVGVIAGSMAMVLFPAFSTLGGAQDRVRLTLLFNRSTKYVVLAVTPIYGLVALFGPEILTGWLDQPLAVQSAPVLRILAVGASLQLLTVASYVLLQGLGRSDVTAKFHLAETPLYLVAMWWLVPLYGIRGAAYAWSGRLALDAFLLLVATRRLEVWTWQSAGGAVTRVVLPVAVLCILSALFYSLPVALAVKVVLVGGLLLGFGWWVWARSLESDERSWMIQLVFGWRGAFVRLR